MKLEFRKLNSDVKEDGKGEEKSGNNRANTVSEVLFTDTNQSVRGGVGSPSMNLLSRIEVQHEVIMEKSQKIIEEISKYANTQNKRRQFQEKPRISRIKELVDGFNKRNTLVGNQIFRNKLVPQKEVSSLEKLKTSRYNDAGSNYLF